MEQDKKYLTKDEFGRWVFTNVKPTKTLEELESGYTRNCPSCGISIRYRFKDLFDFESKNKIICNKCQCRKETPSRNCPKCGKELHYINKYVYFNAIKKNGVCNSCSKLKSVI